MTEELIYLEKVIYTEAFNGTKSTLPATMASKKSRKEYHIEIYIFKLTF